MRKKIFQIFEEYLEAQDYDDTVSCLKKENVSEPSGIPAESVIMWIFEFAANRKKDSDYILLADLCTEFYEKEMFADADFHKGT